MRLSYASKVTALAAILLISSTPFATSQRSVQVEAVLNNAALAEHLYVLEKRAGEDDHDHDHDHDHAHDPVKEGDDHAGHDHEGEAEKGHSHGPARTCEAHDHDHGEYVVWHHILALFVLMVIAGLGCVLPMVMRDNARTRFAVQLGKYFGAGVVLSVAFIHILPEALFSLTHPCLSKAWTDDYPGYAPLIMMVSGLTMLVIEFLASSLAINVAAQSKTQTAALESGAEVHGHSHSHDDHDDHWHSHDQKGETNSSGSITPPTAAHVHGASPVSGASTGHENDGCNHAHGLTLLQCGPGVSNKVSTYMLEIGIALHSVFIGIALGVLAGSEFLAMTIAICFHQFFEGVALGARIADLTFTRRLVPFLLVLAFALVTPLGVAIGMGMRTSYKANSVENLIVMGVCDSIACGVLLYTAFVTLLGGDILYSERFRTESRASKACYLVAVWMGALAMA
ncbi:high-affinity Zn(2+) transporter zrt1, partial [Podila horticola]